MRTLIEQLLDTDAIVEGGLQYCVPVMRAAAGQIEALDSANVRLRARLLVREREATGGFDL
jgi:hypothetical protein